MSGVDLNLLCPSTLELLEGVLRLFQKFIGGQDSETDVDATGVIQGMSPHLDGFGVKRPRTGLEYEMKRVITIEIKTRELGRGVVERVGDRAQPLTVLPDREGNQFGLGQL